MFRRIILCLLLAHGAAHANPLDEATKLYENGQYDAAAKQLQPLAEAGDAAAQHKLSVMYFYGRGVPENETQAMQWARRSADSGNADAMYFIATMYVFGDKVPETVTDPDLEAAKWMFEAASRGHADAEYGLGLLFLAGKGVVQSQEEALKWIGLAAEHGHTGAKSFMSGRNTH